MEDVSFGKRIYFSSACIIQWTITSHRSKFGFEVRFQVAPCITLRTRGNDKETEVKRATQVLDVAFKFTSIVGVIVGI